jgi:hypothetical protein
MRIAFSMLVGFLNSPQFFRSLSDFANGNQRLNGLPDVLLPAILSHHVVSVIELAIS